jgi:hypothetical protein
MMVEYLKGFWGKIGLDDIFIVAGLAVLFMMSKWSLTSAKRKSRKKKKKAEVPESDSDSDSGNAKQ